VRLRTTPSVHLSDDMSVQFSGGILDVHDEAVAGQLRAARHLGIEEIIDLSDR
jgi:hypothetical protein